MAKKDVDLDHLDLDDFDFDIPEWKSDDEVDDNSRKPVERVAKGALSGAKDELASTAALRKALTLALPAGYGLAADTIENVATDARSLYDKVTGDSPQLVRGSKAFGRKAMQLVGNKLLTKKAADRLNNALEDTDDSPVKSAAQYKKEQEDNDIAQLAEIFKAKTGADEERAQKDAAEKLEDKALDQVRFKSTVQVLTAINRSMARMVGYQDKITAKYQQKMLELNYRQFATQKQLLDVMAEATQKQAQILEAIRHNTALPEAVKIRGSEMFKQMAHQRLMGQGLNTISNWSQNYTKQIMDNVSGMVQGAISPLTEAQGMTEGMDIDKHELGGRVVGSMIGSTIRDQASMHIAPWLYGNKHIAKGGEKLRKTFTGLPQKVNEYAQSETQGTGFKSVMTQMFKTFLPQFSLDSRPGGESVDKLDEIGTFDKIARRSLIEIIPGYLSEIAHWSKVAVTGEKDSEKQVYNVVRGGFTSQGESLKDVGRQIMSRSERDSLRTAADDFIKQIGGDTMSSKAQRALKQKLLDELANGRDLVPKRLVDPAQYPNTDVGIVDEITSLIADAFNLDYNGDQQDQSAEGVGRFNDIRDKFLSMASMIPAAGDRIRILGDVLGKDSLRKLGYIERQGRDDRINYDKIWGSVLDEDDEASADGTPKGGPNADDRGGKRSDSGNGPANGPGDLTRRADRADLMGGKGRRARQGASSLEHYLGDKSTLISLITQSRDFHSETVELLKQLAACGCHGEGGGASRGNRPDWSKMSAALRNKGTKAQAWGQEKFKLGQEKYGKAKELAKDIWIQGEDHPRLQEIKLQAGEYRDKATNEVIKKWEDIQGDVVDLKGRTIVRYNELMDSGVVAGYKGKITGTFADKYAKLKGSRAGMWAAGAMAGGRDRLSKLGGAINDMRGTGGGNELLDNLGRKVSDKGAMVSKELQQQRRKFRPRMKRMMSRFTGGKVGADVSSELTGDNEQDMLTLTMRSVQLQYETLKQVTQEKIRKGSFQDINAKRDEMLGKAKEMAKEKGKDVQGLFAKGGGLAGLMAMLGKKGEDGEEGGGGGGIMDSLGDLFGGGDGNERGSRKTRRRAGRTGKLGKIANWGGRALDKMGTAGKILKGGLKGGAWLTKTAGKVGWWGAKTAGRLGWGALRGAGSILTNPLTRMAAGFAGRMAMGALLGAAGLVSAPVLAAAAVVGGAIAVGAYIYSRNKDKLPPLTRMRMVQYGIKPKTDSDELKTLLELEKIFTSQTAVDSEGKATINSQGLPQDKIMQLFKIDTSIPAEENETYGRLIKFLTGRFSAVYLAHVSNMHALTKSMDLSQIDAKVTGKVAMGFVDKAAMNDRPEVFNAMISPFEDEKLDMDAGDVKDVIAEVKGEIQEYINENEKTGKDKADQNMVDAVAAAGGISAAVVAKTAANADKQSSAGTSASKPSGAGAGLEATSKTTGANLTAAQTVSWAGNGGMAAAATAAIMAGSNRDGEIDDGKPVRYRVYGLTEMLMIKVGQLDRLEGALYPMVNYDNEKRAFFKDEAQAYQIAEALFSPIGAEADAVYVWFYRRFMPTFLQYCSSVRARANIDAKDAAERLKPQDLLEVLRETANTRDNAGISVWDVSESPWPGYYLNDDDETVKEPLYMLSTKIKDKTLTENSAAVAGQVRDKDGKIIEQDGNQVNRPASADGQGSQAAGSGGPGGPKEEQGMFSSMWSGIKSVFGGGDESKSPQQGNVSASGQPQAASGATAFTPGTPLTHPGGGAGGNINDVPTPTGDGWDATKGTLMAAANMVGVDPSLAASIAGVESNFKPNAIPYKNPRNPSAGVLSSAASFYQVIKGTWKSLMGKYASKYGINPNTTQHDPRANALLGLEYIKENIDVIKKVKSNVTDTDVYLAHFLGPYGAKRFLKAPPGDPAINHVGPEQAAANPSIFYDSNKRPRTVAAVYNDFDGKLQKHRKPDAMQIASTLKGGKALAAPGEGGVDTSASGPQTAADEQAQGQSTVAATGPSVPSMVKPTGGGGSGAPNTVAEAPASADTAGLAEKADARQTQNTTAGLAMAAKTAEVQSSSQTAANTNTYGGGGDLGRLVEINQGQLDKLLELVELVKNGGTVMPNAAQGAPAQQVAQTTQNPLINTPKPAAKGTVSVGRT
ncbi:Transglycosylase SLT domain protein [compost metagenome]